MRYFNTHGPVNAQEHYVVPRRALVEQLTAQIEQGKFFTIYAPRQMGKTTLLRALDEELDLRPDYLSLALSFEAYERTIYIYLVRLGHLFADTPIASQG